MDAVSELVAQMCKIDKRGGRCVPKGDRQLLLYDIPVWSDSMTQQLAAHFPYCSVTSMQSEQSSTGFCVVIENRAHHSNASAIITLVSMLTATAVVVRLMLDHHNGGEHVAFF
eukprot:3933671-Rhodomonas_salina.1